MSRILYLLLLCVPVAVLAQDAKEISLTQLLTGADSAMLANAHEIVRNEEMVYKVIDEGQGELTYSMRVTLLNSKSNAATLVVYYSPDAKISSLSATMEYQLGSEEVKYKMKDFADYSAVSSGSIYGDNRVKVLEIQPKSYPCTFSYGYTLKKKGVPHVVFPAWVAQNFHQSVERASFTLDVPSGYTFNYKQFNLTQEPKVSHAGGREHYIWSVNDLPAIIEEPNQPARLELLPAVYTAPSAFTADGYAGSMSSWNDYGKFVYQLHTDRDVLPELLAEKVKSIAAGAASDRDKIAALYRFMQENTRYVSVQLGIGGWQPFSAEYVYNNGYGDCKALSNYMHTMLKEVGIESFQTLIHMNEPPYEIDPDFARPNFNHQILYVPAEDMWLECTSSHNPPGYLGMNTADRPVLLITPEGGKLTRTPALDANTNLENHTVQIDLTEKGVATVDFVGTYQGGNHEWCRWAEFTMDSKDREELLRETVALPSFSLQDLTITNSRTEPTAKVMFTAEVPRYAARAGKRIFVPLNPVNPRNYVPAPDDNRQHLIKIRRGFTEETRIEVALPEGFTLEGLPIKEEEVKSSFGSYRASAQMEGDKLVYTRRFRVEPQELTAGEYAAYRDFYLQVAKLDGAKMVLVQKKT